MKAPLYPGRAATSPAEENYLRDGFCVMAGLAPIDQIDNVLAAYQSHVIPFEGQILRANCKTERNEITPEGHVTMPFLNPHDEYQTPELAPFARTVTRLLAAPPIREALMGLMGEEPRLEQSMLFDRSPDPPTRAHQDAVYIDSLPSGHLIAAWIALEDIHPDAGPLYFLPWAETPELPHFTHDDVFKNDIYMPAIDHLIEGLKDRLVAPPMKKGDVLLWNSRVIHGAHWPRDWRLSRKSLACHYTPRSLGVGNTMGDVFNTPYVMAEGMMVRSGRIRLP